MQVDTTHLQALGQGLMGLRQSGQFCDAMVFIGSTRLLVHKVVLSAASQTLHDLAEDFDSRADRTERDQLEIIIPSDVRLSAVNMFINYLYSGQLQLSARTVVDMQRLATLFGIERLSELCDEYSRNHSLPGTESQSLPAGQHISQNISGQIEPDSSTTNGAVPALPDDVSSASNLSRNNSVCSNASLNENLNVVIKTEPPDFTSSVSCHGIPVQVREPQCVNVSGKTSTKHPMSFLEKLMSPVVNVKKLPSTITPDTVVVLDDSDDESSVSGKVNFNSKSNRKLPKQYTLEEKEQIALEAKRFGTTRVANSYNIPLQDILSWMMLFGLRHPGNQRSNKLGKQVNYEADLAIVRWIVQQSEMHQDVSLESMKRYAITIYRNTNPKFVASKTWLGNFLKRNMSVLQGTKFVNENGTTKQIGEMETTTFKDDKNKDKSSSTSSAVLKTLGTDTVSAQKDEMPNTAGALDFHDDDDDDDDHHHNGDTQLMDFNISLNHLESDLSIGSETASTSTPKIIPSHFGRRPIIVAPPKSLDTKSERKLVQWVLERNSKDGYVFTDDFKEFAKSLYTGTKKFAATQAWMTKFLRRNRALKDVKFCSKFKNQYTENEKQAAVTLARRFGVTYAAKHTGLNHKVIQAWKMKEDREGKVPNFSKIKVPAGRPQSSQSLFATSPSSASASSYGDTVRGIVPEFEHIIVEQVLQIQAKEGSVSYDDISTTAQVIYSETRPSFKASYKWVKNFLDRHHNELKDIELNNVNKVLAEDEVVSAPTTRDISDMITTALENLEETDVSYKDGQINVPNEAKRPIVVGPAVTFNRKTEKLLVDWVVVRNKRDGYVFTDDFRDYAKSSYTGTKNFTASKGWLQLFIRRHREIKNVQFKSKFKSYYTAAEKLAAVNEARRYGTGHVGRKLGIDPSLLSAWKIKMEQESHRQTFWKWGKSRKLALGLNFGKSHKLQQSKIKLAADQLDSSGFDKPMDAARGIVPEFENRIVSMILDQHNRDGSISYEDISKISQSVYKETRPTFKAAYGWIRSFMKRHEHSLKNIDIENIKKIIMPEEMYADVTDSNRCEVKSSNITHRPIIISPSRSLDTKTERRLVQWLIERQTADGYVFLDQFKDYAKSLYKGSKKFAATRAWMLKFLRRNNAKVKDVKFTSRFRREYTREEKTAIVEEARKYGIGHVARKTGVDHCLIYSWKVKMDKEQGYVQQPVKCPTGMGPLIKSSSATACGSSGGDSGPGLYSVRGIVPHFEKIIIQKIMECMDAEGSVSYDEVSRISRSIYKETRPNFKASYNWVKDFIKRHKKALRHAEFDSTKKILFTDDAGEEVLIAADKYLDNVDRFVDTVDDSVVSMVDAAMKSIESYESATCQSGATDNAPIDIVIDNPEDPNYETQLYKNKQGQGIDGQQQNRAKQVKRSTTGIDIRNISARKPIIVGAPVTFDRKAEKVLVQWLLDRQARDSYVFPDDFRRFARSQYKGDKKFGATNAWLTKFLRRNRIAKNIVFQSRLKGNNPKFEEKIISLILEHQRNEGSVSYNDIQRITQSVYKDTRPNFRACYNWTRDFIKRHNEALKDVELENVKKYFYPGDEEKDGVLIRDIDPLMGLPLMDSSSEIGEKSVHDVEEFEDLEGFENDDTTNSWTDIDTTTDFDVSLSTQASTSSSDLLEKLSHQKRPIIVAPPKMLDIKTEKKLVSWMLQKQEEQGCVYLDVFKDYARSLHEGPKRFSATNAWMTRFMQRNHNALKNVKVQSRFRRDYSISEKIAAVEEARRLGCHHVGRKLGINGGVIYSWKSQMDNAERTGSKVNAFSDSDYSSLICDSEMKSSVRGMVPEFEERIVAMVLELQESKGSVSNDEISHISKSIYQETRPNFQASYNWVVEFIRRYKKEFKDVVFENQKKYYTEDQKLQILAEEKKYGADHVVEKRKISASTLYQWRRSMRAKSIPIPLFRASVFSSTMGLSTKIKKKYGKKGHKTYTLERKRQIVAEAEKNGVSHASVKLNVTKNMIYKSIQYFRDKGEQIVLKNVNTVQLKKDLEQKIVEWVLEQNEDLGIVTTQRIQQHAQKVFKDAFTMFNATSNWLDGFLVQNAEVFDKVRFRESDDTDREFTDEIKQKLARHATKHGAVKTAELTDLTPGYIYHVKAVLKKKALLLPTVSSTSPPVLAFPTSTVSKSIDIPTTKPTMGPKSKMKERLDRIACKYSVEERKKISMEAKQHGTSTTASRYGIPLPLILTWMKTYKNNIEEMNFADNIGFDNGNLIKIETVEEIDKLITGSVGTSEAKISKNRKSIERDLAGVKKPSGVSKLNVRLPSVEKKVLSKRYSEGYKRAVCEEARNKGVKATIKEAGVPNSTIYSWLKEYGENIESENNATTSVGIKQELDVCSEDSNKSWTTDRRSATPELRNVPESVCSNSEEKRIKRIYSEGERLQIVEHARQIGCKATARETGVPLSNISRWLLHDKREKMKGINKIASSSSLTNSIEVGKYRSISEDSISTPKMRRSDSSLAENVSTNSVQSAEYDVTLDVEDYYMLDEKRSICAKAREIGVKKTSEEASVPLTTLYTWMEKYKDKNVKDGKIVTEDISMPAKDAEERLKTLEEADRIGVAAAAQNASVTVDCVYSWRKEYTYDKLVKNEVSLAISDSGISTMDINTYKRKASSVELDDSDSVSTKKFKYPRLTEGEKKAAVAESERSGCRTVAENVGVSLDLLYKWRQVYKSTVLEMREVMAAERESLKQGNEQVTALETDNENVVLIDEDDDFIVTENVNMKTGEADLNVVGAVNVDINVSDLITETENASASASMTTLDEPKIVNLGSQATLDQYETSLTPALERDLVANRQNSEEKQHNDMNVTETTFPEPQVETSVPEDSDFNSIQITNIKSEFSSD